MTKSDRIAVRVTPELRKALAETANREDRTMSQVIDRAIRAYLSIPKPNLPTPTKQED